MQKSRMTRQPQQSFEHITSHWSQISDPVKFVYRYSPAIRSYVLALSRDENESEDIIQDFLARFLEQRLHEKFEHRGRFRDFLKICVRNTVKAHYRKRMRREKRLAEYELSSLADDSSASRFAEEQWTESWRACVLDKAWLQLEQHQRQQPGNQFYRVLKLRAANPDADSASMAAILGAETGQSVSPESFRKQLSRARRMFARIILKEVRSTIASACPEELSTELAELGLEPYVRDFLETS